MDTLILANAVLFLSTLSLRRATLTSFVSSAGTTDFYPRSPCGERRWLRCWKLAARDISIHALLAESDQRDFTQHPQNKLFLSTLSLRRATLIEFRKLLHPSYFYPRSPCGERHDAKHQTCQLNEFLSTLSLRRATEPKDEIIAYDNDFYPRSPCGERLRGWTLNINGPIFLSTLSLRRATALGLPGWLRVLISIHALLAESDLQNWRKPHGQKTFLSTLSLRRATGTLQTVNVKKTFLSTLSLRRATPLR